MSKKTSFWSELFSLAAIPVVIGLASITISLIAAFEEYPIISAFLVTFVLVLGCRKLFKQEKVINDLKRKYEGKRIWKEFFRKR